MYAISIWRFCLLYLLDRRWVNPIEKRFMNHSISKSDIASGRRQLDELASKSKSRQVVPDDPLRFVCFEVLILAF